jgi:hypothetical protein
VSVTPEDGRAPSTPEKAQQTVEERVMLSQAQVRWLVRSRFGTGFLFGVAIAVCVFWAEWPLSRVL